MDQRSFELLICDVYLGDESGIDLLRELAPRSPEIMVVMITGANDINLAVECLRDGAADFISKPFAIPTLQKVTQRALERQQRLLTQKKNLERHLATLARFPRDVQNPVLQVDRSGTILYANAASSYLTDHWQLQVGNRLPDSIWELVQAGFAEKPENALELKVGDRTYSFNVTTPIEGELLYAYGYDITALKAVRDDLLKMKNRALQLARHDPLTGLPNRYSFTSLLPDLTHPATRSLTAVAMLDVDKFKQINDGYGHQMGDHLLVELAKSIQTHLRAGDFVFRWGGDEILLLIHNATTVPEADEIVNHLKRKVLADIQDKLPFSISITSGCAVLPEGSSDFDAVITEADSALLINKASAGSYWQLHSTEAYPDPDQDLFIDLANAVEGGGIEVHLQPILDVRTSRCISVEALARWHSNRFGSVSPARFISLADSRGLAPSLGRVIIEKALSHLAFLHNQGLELEISINLSQMQLQEETFLERLTAKIEELGLSPNSICMEISEKYPFFSNSIYREKIVRLSKAGFPLVLDDFGAGFSTLQAVAELPLRRVKIDRSLVQKAGTSKGDAILKSLARLAQDLEMELVAEGVETEGQKESLLDLGIFLMQGFLFQRPAISSSVLAYLRKEQAGAPLADQPSSRG